MLIGIVPTVREIYRNQFEFSIDEKLILFLRKLHKNAKIKILTSKKNYNLKFICLSGGNDTRNLKNLKNKKRFNLDLYYYYLAKRKNIPVLGICHGAQFIAKIEGCTLKNKTHIKTHMVFISQNINKFFFVNSYHNTVITKVSKKIEIIAKAEDETIESFKVNKKKIIGIMWHPERYEKFKKIDFKIIKKNI